MTELDGALAVMCAAGLEDDEIVALAWLKGRVLTGKCDDLTLEYKRAIFAKYLYDGGRLGDWSAPAMSPSSIPTELWA